MASSVNPQEQIATEIVSCDSKHIAWGTAGRRLTIRSSRPRVVASAVCFTLRLHTSAAPPQGGLTQALGTKKQSVSA
jgi:hypothetical protein